MNNMKKYMTVAVLSMFSASAFAINCPKGTTPDQKGTKCVASKAAPAQNGTKAPAKDSKATPAPKKATP